MQLAYDEAFHLHCDLKLHSGISIWLDSLQQSRTYGGLLVGFPRTESNDWHIEAVLHNEAQRNVHGARPHLIVPPRRDFFCEPGDMKPIRERGAGPVPEWLPAVTCIGTFEGPSRLPQHSATLKVVWFQDEFALPILEPVLSELLRLDWDALAVQVSFDEY
jgi:hypothetical protein